jgi:two-component system heavy metal sensor histidine kinase CusS
VKSIRWRIALWFAVSLLAVVAAFVGMTYTHLQHELREEKWERAHPGNKDWTLHGSYSEAEVNDIAGELWRSALLYAAPVTALTLGIGYYLAKRSFQPVTEMNRQLRAIEARSLDQRVRLTDADEEFRAIEKNINALLARLDTSFRQLTEFSAQVAHELRTPLTLIRLQLEEAADRLEPGLAESLQDELRRLSDYVDQCLLLATAEQGRVSLEIRPVPLRGLVLEMLEVYELLARSESRTLTVTAGEEISVSADVRSLRQILHNLLTNALRHGEGPIGITVGRDGQDVFCRIENMIGRKASAVGSGTTLGLRLVRALTALQPRMSFSGGTAAGQFVAELRWQ